MHAKICSVCKDKYFENDSTLHYCVIKKISKRNEEILFRTSTPISDCENTPTSSFSDPVTDFFYQSWKNGLHADATETTDASIQMLQIKSSNQWNHQPITVLQPVCYAPQYIYIYVQYYQQVGYRPDGTFGILPFYWAWNFN